MEPQGRPSLERFRVSGNILKLTSRFDPRYQPRAGMELMNIIASLAQQGECSEVIVDVSDAGAMPSMMFGFLQEAKEVTAKLGKRLKVRLNTATYERMNSLGVLNGLSPDDGTLEVTG